ncbi:BatD family protein [Myroides odoratus]|uniref:BatD family protein n=1 Tax=Myroides odoratus TaxID=256 RepID=UPI003341990A
MTLNRTKYNLLSVLILLLSSQLMLAQLPLETKVDTTNIKIGEPIKYSIRAITSKDSKVLFPESETLGSLEILDSYPVDTIKKDNFIELIKIYELTQFDEGSFTIPELPVIIDAKLFKTDSIRINVQNVVVDTLKTPLYDIKSISKAGAAPSTSWYYLAFLLLAIAIGVVIYFIIKKLQDKNLTEDDKYSTPFEKAVTKLKQLEEKQNWTRGDAKPYYSEMTDIARAFIEDTFGISARELTTFETVSILKNTLRDKDVKIDPKIIKEFKRVLDTADLVKFAKSQPADNEIVADTSKTQNIINEINTAYPISAATQTERIRLREERKRKRKRVRFGIPTAISAALILCIGIVYVINITSEQNLSLFTFNSSKRLLQQEWINSTYGSGVGLTVSTPDVLVRKNDPTVGDSGIDGIDNIQQFKSGELGDPIYITLSTIQTGKDFKYTEEEIIDHSLKLIIKNYDVDNIELSHEKFENASGLTGLKAKGDFTLKLDKGKNQKIAFTCVLTHESKTVLNQVWVFHHTEDQYADEITEKVFDSMQYKQEK